MVRDALEPCGAGLRPRADAPVTQVAHDVLGCLISHAGVTVRITEAEAYAGSDDPGAHTFRGRTARNASMFGPVGHAYVYFTYGMHHALNLVCGPEGTGHGVLIRAGEVVDGVDLARSRRGGVSDRDLARGPGRLAQALALDRTHDGMSMEGSAPDLLLVPATVPKCTSSGPRVGVSGPGGDGELFPWRFWITEDPYVSAYRPAKPSRRPARP
ncbi:DNA-3-methyladenine glycosylase [Yimella sp. RIT 621]|uniref:DNA-3-methyladenine glycosylase n=1 Tax=unclassified Yimella TaxID=2649892 RepID=UPI001EFAD362|nr:DNA-3-methyladenine glycosylase [Yimella sp. RIT 621]MCG8655090.1 DNA-3-methyladenine glycosylase [Yimella sp. NH-Cas1]